ncbi:MAG: ROK family protein [Planctomycetaceae bacterium]
MHKSDDDQLIFLGIDLGGTNIKAGLVDNAGTVLGSASVPTEACGGPDHGVSQMMRAAGQAAAAANTDLNSVTAAGLASPGTMDLRKGMLLEPTNLPGWDSFPIRQRVEDAVGKPVVLQNDANAAAYGEYWAGQAKNAGSMAFYTLGTGLGGGLIIDDHIIEGENSHGSELGHVVLEMQDGRFCKTGQYGTAEAYVSATALLEQFRHQLDSGAETSVRACLQNGEELSPLLISREAERGDQLSEELIMEMAMYLGVTVTSCVHIIDPTIVLLGGAMTFGRNSTRIGRQFLAKVQSEFRSRTFPTLAERTVIDWASLGGTAGFIGAAGCARRAHRRNR